MIKKDPLINSSLIFYEDMFYSTTKTDHRNAEKLIEKNKLINTSEILYKDMLQSNP